MAKPPVDAASTATLALEVEKERWRRERAEKDGLGSAAAAAPTEDLTGTILSIIMCFGPGQHARCLEQPHPKMDRWDTHRRKALVLCVIQHDFRTTTDAFSELMDKMQPLEAEDSVAFALDSEEAYRSGALQRIDAIAASEPRALVLEEAGEVPEAMLMALLRIPTLERCVMVGDHQQLRPAVNSYDLQMQKKLDISCFERLVKLGMTVPCLQTQNRMRVNLLPPVLQHYPLLQSNTDRIGHLENVPWLAEPLFWWACESIASRQETSWCNHEQAHRAVQLASFLVKQEAIEAPKITVLVPYASQMFLTRMLLKEVSMDDVGCSTVDQFQGDENEVIILCLVRCDEIESRKLGFLGTVNRMIVATSRQKRALIIIGSPRCFGMHPEWNKLITSMKGADAVGGAGQLGEALPLRCPRHPHKLLSVPDSRCFPASGVGEGCQMSLACGHTCQLKCHSLSQAHGFCKKMVTHVHELCGHVFDYQCHAIPTDCPQKLLITLDCGHFLTTICGSKKVDTEVAVKCSQLNNVELPCGQAISLPCGVPSAGYLDPDFNACSSCLRIMLLGSSISYAKLCKIRSQGPCLPIGGCVPCMPSTLIDACVDTTARLGLCGKKDIDMLRKALRAGVVPHSLAIAAVPDPLLWDHQASVDEKRSVQKKYNEEQGLWRMVLRESGIAVPKEWIKQGLTLITAMALLDVATEGRAAPFSTAAEARAAPSSATVLSHRLGLLHKAGISNTQVLAGVLREAGDALYAALSTHDKSPLWYQQDEKQLAAVVVDRLKAASLPHLNAKQLAAGLGFGAASITADLGVAATSITAGLGGAAAFITLSVGSGEAEERQTKGRKRGGGAKMAKLSRKSLGKRGGGGEAEVEEEEKQTKGGGGGKGEVELRRKIPRKRGNGGDLEVEEKETSDKGGEAEEPAEKRQRSRCGGGGEAEKWRRRRRSPSKAGTTPYTVEEIERLCAMVFEDHENPLADRLRSSWDLPPTSDVLSPPHLEVPMHYLYQISHADRLYVSIDLRSADFHVLSLAVPGLIQQGSWAEWLSSTLDPQLTAKVSFLADLKPLRVRALGKVAHRKNAALRLLARLLVALGLRHAGDFACVDSVFRFSCDELCIKLREGASPSSGLRLSELLQSALKQLHWCYLLPTRLEVFHLQRLDFGEQMVLAQGRADGDDSITKLHLGHPLLYTSAQFVELPSVHDSAWAEPQHLCRPPEQRCDDSYYVRKMDLQGASSQHGTVFKHLPIWARPHSVPRATALPASSQSVPRATALSASSQSVPRATALSASSQSVPRATALPASGQSVPRATALPASSQSVPRATALPASSQSVPRATALPASGQSVPRATALPASSQSVPRATALPASSQSVPRATALPASGQSVPRTTALPASSQSVPRATALPASGQSVPRTTALSASGQSVPRATALPASSQSVPRATALPASGQSAPRATALPASGQEGQSGDAPASSPPCTGAELNSQNESLVAQEKVANISFGQGDPVQQQLSEELPPPLPLPRPPPQKKKKPVSVFSNSRMDGLPPGSLESRKSSRAQKRRKQSRVPNSSDQWKQSSSRRSPDRLRGSRSHVDEMPQPGHPEREPRHPEHHRPSDYPVNDFLEQRPHPGHPGHPDIEPRSPERLRGSRSHVAEMPQPGHPERESRSPEHYWPWDYPFNDYLEQRPHPGHPGHPDTEPRSPGHRMRSDSLVHGYFEQRHHTGHPDREPRSSEHHPRPMVRFACSP
eukprot:gene26391-17485_t